MSNKVDVTPEMYDTINAFYHGFLKREPDADGFYTHAAALKQHGLLALVRNFLELAEFKQVYSGSSPEVPSRKLLSATGR